MKPFEVIDGAVGLTLSPKIYPIDVVYAAAYVFLDRCYIVLDGDPEREILVEVRPKKADQDLERLGFEFYNELLNYATFKSRSAKSKNIRETIVQRALLTAEESKPADPLGITTPIEVNATHGNI